MAGPATANTNRLRAGALALAVALFAGACSGDAEVQAGGDAPATVTTEAPGKPLPVLEPTRTVDGGQFDWNSLEGQDAILWFWAPW